VDILLIKVLVIIGIPIITTSSLVFFISSILIFIFLDNSIQFYSIYKIELFYIINYYSKMKLSWQTLIDKYPENINSILETVNKKQESLKDNLDIYPSNENIFKCFNYCEFNEIKVVIIGQDPYHTPKMATGLCFAVNNGAKIPPSFRNIINELKNDLDIDLDDFTLEKWAKQGILLMNAAFTVIQGSPGSQMSIWSKFTDYIISELNTREKIIFVAWGAFAYNKFKAINTERNYIICSSHPSPLSCFKPFKQFPAFKESKPFSKINTKLLEWDKTPINW